MESLVLQKKKYLHTNSTSMPFFCSLYECQCRSTPWRVYYLGHGGISRSIKDIKILKALQQQGIISRIYPW